MTFHEVALSFESIEKESGRLVKTTLLANLLQRATPEESAIIAYISLGVLHAPHIGTQFGIAGKTVIQIMADVLSSDYDTVSEAIKISGDEGSVLGMGAWDTNTHASTNTSSNMSVCDLYNALQDLENLSGTGSQDRRSQVLRDLLRSLDPLAAKYVLRIVLGKLRLGFSEMTLIDALSWMVAGNKSLRDQIERAYNVCADIGYIAEQLKRHGISALDSLEIQVGTPIRPAAAERLPTARAIIEKLGTCVAQPKLDGFRLQIHIDNRDTKKPSKIHFFSRNLQDMSDMFPDIVQILTNLPVKTMICEGEVVAYDPHTGIFLPFQQTVKRKRKHNIASVADEFPVKIFLFHLLYLNGESQLHKSHADRRKLLLEIIPKTTEHTDSPISVIDEKVITNAQELETYFLQNMDAGLEGLVVKRPDSHYAAGMRNFNWIKLKRQEEGHLEDTLDCVILGYYEGKGKRAQFGIGAFLVGVYNKTDDCFQTVAKIGTGMTDLEWKDLKKQCDAISIKHKPDQIVCSKGLYPDVWVTPKLVCMIRADEITVSQLHSACPIIPGKSDSKCYALRFPRFMGYRDDKGPYEATTVDEILRLYTDQFVS